MIRCVIGFLRADKINLPESEYTGNQIDFNSTFCQFLDFISIITRLMFHSHPGILFKKSLESWKKATLSKSYGKISTKNYNRRYIVATNPIALTLSVRFRTKLENPAVPSTSAPSFASESALPSCVKSLVRATILSISPRPLKPEEIQPDQATSLLFVDRFFLVLRIIYSPWRASLPTQISFPSFPPKLSFLPLFFRSALNFFFPFHSLLFFYTLSSTAQSLSLERRCTLRRP